MKTRGMGHCLCEDELPEVSMFKLSQLYVGAALAALAEILIRVAVH